MAPHRHGSSTINYTRRLSLTLTSSPLFMKYASATSGHQFPLVRPRASRPSLYSLLCSLVNRLIAHASLPLRFMIERRFRHTSTRGSVARGLAAASQFALRAHPTRRLWRGRITRRTSYRRFIGDFVHSSLLRRSATPPHEAPISQTPRLPAAKANPLCASASLRLCVKIKHSNISHFATPSIAIEI